MANPNRNYWKESSPTMQ